jgi:hypothetical protein
MRSPGTVNNGLNRIALRQAGVGVVGGLILGLLLQGHAPLPVAAIDAALTGNGGIRAVLDYIGDAQYRVVMRCPVKNHRVVYHVKSPTAELARQSLDWVLPACQLIGIASAPAGEDSSSWFQGQFACQGNSYRKSYSLTAAGLRQARELARSTFPGCRVETIDQTACAAIDPLCRHESEDFKIEAELARYRLLR